MTRQDVEHHQTIFDATTGGDLVSQDCLLAVIMHAIVEEKCSAATARAFTHYCIHGGSATAHVTVTVYAASEPASAGSTVGLAGHAGTVPQVAGGTGFNALFGSSTCHAPHSIPARAAWYARTPRGYAVLRYAADFLPSWAGAISIDLMPAVLVLILVAVHGAIRRDENPDVSENVMTAADMIQAMRLYDRMRRGPAHWRCRGKTGTLSNVSALSGYCEAQSGENYVYSILMNGVYPPGARRLQDRMLQAIAALG